MDMRQFGELLRELEQDRVRDIASDRVVERFVLDHLPELEMAGRTPIDILSPETIDLLFQRGALQLNSMGKAGVFYIDSGRLVDISAEGEIYRRLLGNWEKLGWIRIERDQSGDIAAIHLSVRPKS